MLKFDISNIFISNKLSLFENGINYASFKHGDFEGELNEIYFNDVNEPYVELFKKLNFKTKFIFL